MTAEQILKKAIEEARKNGYVFEYNLKACQYNFYYYAFIFSHDFAKAFWGEKIIVLSRDEKTICTGCFECGLGCIPDNLPAWQTHLRIMVLEPEPLRYLEKFL